MRYLYLAAVGTLLMSSATDAAKPPASYANPQVAYVSVARQGMKLIVADENGLNTSTLFASSSKFRFDLAPRGQAQVAISSDDGKLRLLSYTTSGNGTISAAGSPVELAAATSGNIDFSPDGRKIAYACCSGGGLQKLMVYDLDTQTSTEWATVEYLWDVAFFRGGNSIAFVAPKHADGSTTWELYEITAPGSSTRMLRSNPADFDLDASRINPDALVIGHHDAAGNAYVGLWQAPVGSETEGHFLASNLTNRTIAFKGTLNCNDQKLAYVSSTTPSGGQVFFIRNLVSGQDALFRKDSGIQLQFWPTCS